MYVETVPRCVPTINVKIKRHLINLNKYSEKVLVFIDFNSSFENIFISSF